MPLLPSNNHFSVLPIHEFPDNIKVTKNDQDAQPIPTPPRRPKWEKKLGPKLIIRSLEQGPNSIFIPIHLKTTDTLEEVNTEALVDCGATGDFIDESFVE